MNENLKEHLKTILAAIPEKPGSYQYYDEKGTIIYVGKAKNLKRRVSSYFNKEHDNNKTISTRSTTTIRPGFSSSRSATSNTSSWTPKRTRSCSRTT